MAQASNKLFFTVLLLLLITTTPIGAHLNSQPQNESNNTDYENKNDSNMKNLEKNRHEVHKLRKRTEKIKMAQDFVDELNEAQDYWTATVHENFALMGKKKIDRLMAKFDAREKWPECADFIGMVTDQGRCSSSWAISAASVLTDRFCIERLKIGKRTYPNYPASYASAQDTMEFTPGANGCNGADPKLVWEWYAMNDVVSGTNYSMGSGCKPYLINHLKDKKVPVKDAFCKFKCNDQWPYGYKEGRIFKLKNAPTHWAGKDENREEDMMREIMENGPIQVSVVKYMDIHHYGFNEFSQRVNVYVYTNVNGTGTYEHGGSQLTVGKAHTMKLIGWGEEAKKDGMMVKYWLGVNSWNTDWGLNGLFKWRRGTDECGIETLSVDFGIPEI
ncbi:hypothetical protein niasHT_036454 [Heterodera trifolii]|uniref:Peptidase C1A papain C-terminal domain-containing protein n=1 Tax=Heterodera trifolii TaxID=157864 RepID=A0ABD2J6P5_9BILA